MKQTCPECKSVIEIDEKKYQPGESITIHCPLCETTVIFSIPNLEPIKPEIIEKVVVKEVDNPENLRRINELEQEIHAIKRNYAMKYKESMHEGHNAQIYLQEDNIRNKLTSIFSFNGRIERGEYTLSLLIYYIVCFMLEWSIIIIPFAVWMILAQGSKRCHDLSHSGWWQLIPFYFLWMLFAKGNNLRNEYN